MTTNFPRSRSSFQRIFSPQNPWDLILFYVVTVALSVPFSESALWMKAASALVLLYPFWHWYRQRQRAREREQLLTAQLDKKAPEKAQALILLISPFNPTMPALKDPEIARQKIEALLATPVDQLRQEDFDELGLLHSNLRPQLEAVAFHSPELREVWLLTTQTEHADREGEKITLRGSEQAGRLLARYLAFERGQQLQVHWEGLTIPSWDYLALWKKVEEIYRQSHFKEEAILADVTGGTKMMSVALTLACLAPHRKMEYVSTDRDWQGEPLSAGKAEPILIDVAPLLITDPIE